MKSKRNGSKKIMSTLVALGILVFLVTFFQFEESQDNLAEILGVKEEWAYLNQEEGSNTSEEKVELVEVARIVDGDTVVLSDNRTVRYLNIDTPETKKPGTPIQCFGPEASQMNKSLVEGKKVVIKADKEFQDKYDRELRFIFLEGENVDNVENSINARLVRMGFARASIYEPNSTYADVFYKLERQAKSENLGIWKNCDNPFAE